MEVFFSAGASCGALRVKVLIQQQHAYRITFEIFEINMRFLQKILSQILWRDIFMGSQCPAQLCHYLAFYCIGHFRIINFRNRVGLIH
ncbi:hypothetical protein HA38_00935 [Pantoea allii]|nr:hypothetical protein HA38_00935 [Pantoea allii]PBJ98923.1 hypothetical protein CMR03_19725 [Pantoea allii]